MQKMHRPTDQCVDAPRGGGRKELSRSLRPPPGFLSGPYLHLSRVVNRLGLLFLLELGPLIDPLLSLVSLDSVTFLQLADEALAPAGNIVKIVVGKLTPLLLHG